MTRVPIKPSQGVVSELAVREVGDSVTVALPKEIVSQLSTQDGIPLYLMEAPDGGDRLLPHDPGFQAQMAKAHDIIGRYRNALQILAR